MNTDLIKIENNNLTFLLKRNQVNLVVLENKKIDFFVSVFAGKNSKFDCGNFGTLNLAKDKFNKLTKEFLPKDDFIEFGSEKDNLFFIRKSFLLSFVEVKIPGSNISDFYLVDLENNRYFLGKFSYSDFSSFYQKFL